MKVKFFNKIELFYLYIELILIIQSETSQYKNFNFLFI